MLRVATPRTEGLAWLGEDVPCLGKKAEGLEPQGGGQSGWLLLPTDALSEILTLLPARDLCAVACCSRVVRPLVEADANWSRLFEEQFPRLVLILGHAKPQWWGGATWRQRYAALASGAPFHAQVYNREQDNDQEDFMLSCYDATLRLSASPSAAPQGAEPMFAADYPAMGRMPVVREQGITQQRLRAAPTSCLPTEVFCGDGQEVAEGDEVEVQWKGRRSHPFGWWFGRVRTIHEGRVVLEFLQYPQSSVWRRVKAPLRPGEEAMVNEDSTFGFLGGLRRLAPSEATEWWQHCPPHRIWEAAEADGARQEEAPLGQAAPQQGEDIHVPAQHALHAVLGVPAAEAPQILEPAATAAAMEGPEAAEGEGGIAHAGPLHPPASAGAVAVAVTAAGPTNAGAGEGSLVHGPPGGAAVSLPSLQMAAAPTPQPNESSVQLASAGLSTCFLAPAGLAGDHQ